MEMDDALDEDFPAPTPRDPMQFVKTYSRSDKGPRLEKQLQYEENDNEGLNSEFSDNKKAQVETLSTLDAVTFLLNGSLKNRVCRYCLSVKSDLTELDEVFQVASNGSLYKITLKDMVASFYPFKVTEDQNLPNKICNECTNRTISSYLFAQQCERSERALRNCFEDMYEQLNKLDSLDRPKKRGRQKLNPNYNKLHTENKKVIDYAEPLYHLVHANTIGTKENKTIGEFECHKCFEILPDLISLLNHNKSHPKSMWYNCRFCGQSFPKIHHLKRHLRIGHPSKVIEDKPFMCGKCGTTCDSYNEFLEHKEKHKFKSVMEHLVGDKMHRLCAICLNQDSNMSSLDEIVCLHGGSKELSGDKPLLSILASTLPEINLLENYTGSKICKKCVDNAITSYIFINQTYFVRNRLSTCISYMVDNLNQMDQTNKNICIEIDQSVIMKTRELNEIFNDNDLIDTKSNIEVLEDEFRLKSEDDEDQAKSDTNPLSDEKPIKISDIKEEPNVNGYINEKPNSKKFVIPKFTCPLCSKHFVSDYFLKKHVIKHSPMKVECKVCDLKFKSKFHLYEHNKIHVKNKKYKKEFVSCKDCGRYFNNENRLKIHIKSHFSKLCQICDKVFKSQSHFNGHIEKHMFKIGTQTQKWRRNCSFCEKDCSNDNEFSLHVNKAHLQIKPYSCDMCEGNFYTEYNLRYHKRLHSLKSREKCRFCNKILPTRKQLVIHIRKHIGDKPFHCQICNESFYSQSKTIQHMKISHGGRFWCKICKITFATKKGFEKHVH